MKNIIMVLGIGINERGWASVMSKHGRVTLIQLGPFEHVEIWENGERFFNGPTRKIPHWVIKLDQALVSSLTAFRAFGLIWKYTSIAKADVVLTVFFSVSFAAWLLQRLGRVRRTISFLADYLPPRGKWWLKLHRQITNGLTKQAALWSDEAWVLSSRIAMKLGLKKDSTYLVPVALGYFPTPLSPREEIGYIGYPSHDHALDILFEIAKRHNFKLNIIGDSPYLQSIKHQAPPQTVFHGLLNDEKEIGKILAKCFCGYAIYRCVSSNSYSYYGFPSKTLYCFASNVPVVITNVAEFNQEFEKRGVGHVVPPEPGAIEVAILDLKKNYTNYSQAIDHFRSEWNQGVENFHRERLAALMGG
jgi:glycosyltransferase involved in cell wall biosynthesis